MLHPLNLCGRMLACLVPAALALQSCDAAPGSAETRAAPCVVARVADGDTFSCRDGRRVRLIGIDAPELAQGEPGRLARAALGALVRPGTTVRLERDAASHDRYGRELAHVWTGSRLVNEAMVLQGWALLYTLPPNVKYAERLERAQKKARAAGVGLWGTGGFECAPSTYRRGECRPTR